MEKKTKKWLGAIVGATVGIGIAAKSIYDAFNDDDDDIDHLPDNSGKSKYANMEEDIIEVGEEECQKEKVDEE